jgi:hypothetical protein
MPATVLTNVGKGIVTNRIKGAGSEPNYVHWGTGTTVAAATQTALVTASAEARVAGTSTQQTTTTTSDTYRVVATLTSASTQAITEAGLFDASTAGNMFVRGDFAAINLANGDSIQFTINVQFT